jgi:UDP-2,4-diacetamido-2,4,6-trideoxy-beta-L-altropyranose hydrolase
MRCLALADTLSSVGYEPVMLSRSESFSCAPSLSRSGLRVVSTRPESNGSPEARHAGLTGARVAVVDHYDLTADDEQAIAGIADIVVACEDLPTRRHSAAILIDPTPERCEADYAGLVQNSTSLHLGPRQALIGRGWREARKSLIDNGRQRSGSFRILVSMGATDPSDATSRVIAAIHSAHIDCEIDVVMGAGAPHLPRVRGLIGSRVRLHADPSDLPALVGGADLAIGAPGSSSFERAVLGVPSIAIPVATNQHDFAAALARAGAALLLDEPSLDDQDRFGAVVRELFRDDARRREISDAAFLLCDGRGTSRILPHLAGQTTSRDGARISLRLAEMTDCDWLLELQLRPETRAHARNPAAPKRDEHVRWFTRALADPDRYLTIIERDGRDCGFARLDKRLSEFLTPTYEVSIAIEPELHGSGLGRAALALVRKMAPGAVLEATVLAANSASRALFLGSGYAQVGVELFRSLPK